MESHPIWIFSLFGLFFIALIAGIPVAWALGGSAFIVTGFSAWSNATQGTDLVLDWNTFSLSTERIYGLIENETLVALPMFILMGHILDKSGISQRLMVTMSRLFGKMPGGLAAGVVIIGVLLAASTGIIGASVVLLATICLPAMREAGYSMRLACGTICGAGTLGILIPPSIMLVIMADRLQLPVADLFGGSLVPGLVLAGLYIVYILGIARFRPQLAPASQSGGGNDESLPWWSIVKSAIPVTLLILIVLGSIFTGIAPPTEASGLGAAGAFILALVYRGGTWKSLKNTMDETVHTMGFLFAIFIGASCFALALRLLGGDEWIRQSLAASQLSGQLTILVILVFIFILGFFLDWIEITLIALPIISQVVDGLSLPWAEAWGGSDAVLLWFAILCALVLQTSFLTPPVGFALFYLKGTDAAGSVRLKDIYAGIIPFVIIQLVGVAAVFVFPGLVLWLPSLRG